MMNKMDKTTKCCGYEVHEAATLFPLMSEPELKELAEDIKTNGLIYPVIMCDKKVLDGRNRLLACEIADVCVYFRDFKAYRSEHTPTSWVLATNLKRRQLTVSQRAAAGTNALPLLEAEAKERQIRKSVKEIIPEQPKGQARDKAAKLLGVNPRYISDGKKIKEKSPELFQQIVNGKKTISAAKKELGWERLRQEPERQEAQFKAFWLQCTKQKQEDLRAWQAEHSK